MQPKAQGPQFQTTPRFRKPEAVNADIVACCSRGTKMRHLSSTTPMLGKRIDAAVYVTRDWDWTVGGDERGFVTCVILA